MIDELKDLQEFRGNILKNSLEILNSMKEGSELQKVTAVLTQIITSMEMQTETQLTLYRHFIEGLNKHEESQEILMACFYGHHFTKGSNDNHKRIFPAKDVGYSKINGRYYISIAGDSSAYFCNNPPSYLPLQKAMAWINDDATT